MSQSKQHSYIGPRQIRPLKIEQSQVTPGLLGDLRKIGLDMSERDVRDMLRAFGFDAMEPMLTTPGVPTPIQFLQQWLPGLVYVITQARKIDELIGVQTVGAWEDEQIVQIQLERLGVAVPYGDSANVTNSSWNPNFETRTVVRGEEGLFVGELEDARTARIPNMNTLAEKRGAALLALEIFRNEIGFSGYLSGLSGTYGFLNDPGLPAYVAAANGSWLTATFVQIQQDIITAVAALRTRSGDNIDPATVPCTLAVASAAVDALATTNDHGVSVRKWIADTYPQMRVVSAPELDAADGGSDVFYLYAETVQDGSTDGGATWLQAVPAKVRMIGSERKSKGYEEVNSNATAGAFLKRPYAVVRYSGLEVVTP